MDPQDPINEMIAEGGGNAQPPAQQPPAVDYAKMYSDAQAQMQIQSQQINQLIQQQQAMMQQTQQQQPTQQQQQVDPFAKFDTDTAQALRAVTDNITNTFKAELARRDEQLVDLRAGYAVQSVAPNVPPEIANKAKQLYANLQKKGIPVNAQETLDMVIGEAVRNGTYQQPTRQAPNVLNGGSAPQRQTTRPVNFDNLSYREQVKVLETTGELDAEF